MNQTTTDIVSDHIQRIGALEHNQNALIEKQNHLDKKINEAKLDVTKQIFDLKLLIIKENNKIKRFAILVVSIAVAVIAGADGAIEFKDILAVFL